MNSFLSPLAERLGWALLHSLWQGLAVALLLAGCLRIWPGQSAAVRSGASLLAMLICGAWFLQTACTIPLAEIPPAPQNLGSPAPQGESSGAAAGSDIPSHPAPVGSMVSWQSGSTPAQAEKAVSSEAVKIASDSTPWRERIKPWVSKMTFVWMAGVLWLCLRHVSGWLRIHRWRRYGEVPEPDLAARFSRLVERCGLSSKVMLKISTEVAMPMLTGFLRPIVIFPIKLLTGLTNAETEAILLHELAHVVRRDAWANLLQVLIETVLFYHPAVRWMSRKAREERELAADDLALHFGTERRVYARALVRVAERQAVPDFTLGASGGSLLRRVRRILLPEPKEPAGSFWPVSVVSGTALLILSVVFQAGAQTAPIITVKAGESLQAAIDAAPPGAVVRVGAGEWKERVVITKPLTLEGAGWQQTLLRPDRLPEAVAAERQRWIGRKANKPASADELAKDWAGIFDPTITIRGVKGVTVRGFKVQGLPVEGNANQALYPYMLVLVEHAEATIRDCTMTGYYVGISVQRDAVAEVENCTLAALWHTGVNVDEGGTLHFRDSEARNCYYAGLVIGRGCDTTTIERSRISGAAWHGIRWDDASPTVTGCAIFGNDRAGIYVGGRGHLQVRNNVFWKNGSALAAGPENTGVIQGNVLAGHRSAALYGSANLHLRVVDNIFADNPVGFSISLADGRGGRLEGRLPEITNNTFWKNATAFEVDNGRTPLPASNAEADPRFAEASRGNFIRSAGGAPSRAVELDLSQEKTPLLAEERQIIPSGDTRSSSRWQVPGGKNQAYHREREMERHRAARPLINDVFQVDDSAKRAAALETVRRDLESGDEEQKLVALTAFTQFGRIDFDRAPFRAVIRKLLQADLPEVRGLALQALIAAQVQAEDLPLLYALADDTSATVRGSLTSALMVALKNDLTGPEATKAMLKLMSKLPDDPRSVAHSMWGGKYSPEIEARVLELCQDIDSSPGSEFFYGALSTQGNKSEAVCRRLVEILAHPDIINRAGRAAWGLQQGVSPAQYPLVATGVLRVLEARTMDQYSERFLECLRAYGGPGQIAGVDRLLAKPGVSEHLRQQLEETKKTIAARPAVPPR